MKQRHITLMLLLAFLLAGATKNNAQTCPPPENLHIRIIAGPPPSAHISWDTPAGGNVVGYLFTYSINGGPSISQVLNPWPTENDVLLPNNWQEISVTLQSICADGSLSGIERGKVTNIIIEDLVLANQIGLEARVCTNPCSGSTHFFYSQGSGLNGSTDNGASLDQGGAETSGLFETFKNSIFCHCMARNGNNYLDQGIVDGCRLSAREFLNPAAYFLTVCQAAGRDEQGRDAGAWAVRVFPNPVADQLNIQVDAPVAGGVYGAVADVTGWAILSDMRFPAGGTSIPVSAWKSGVYILTVQSEDGQKAHIRFVKQ